MGIVGSLPLAQIVGILRCGIPGFSWSPMVTIQGFEGEQKSLGLPLFLHILKENYH
jgi:hypothetical protein